MFNKDLKFDDDSYIYYVKNTNNVLIKATSIKDAKTMINDYAEKGIELECKKIGDLTEEEKSAFGLLETADYEFNLKASDIRSRRDYLISKCDWVTLPDVTISNKPDWLNYRQALRDITDQPTFPDSVIWPTEPILSTTPPVSG